MKRSVQHYFLFFFISVFSLNSCGNTKNINANENVVASHYLVRHAEKVDNSRDPGLTDEGKERAYYLAEHLKNITFSHIYSTDYFRTRLTAQPSSSLRNMELTLYDASDLEAYSRKVHSRHNSENILITGHSNTTPQLAAFLCPSAEAIAIEDWEYDKLFRIDYFSDGSCSCTRIKFGKTSVEQ